MRISKRAGLLIAAAVGGAVGGYLAVLIGLLALGLAWNLLSIFVRIESQDFSSDGWVTFGGSVALVGALVGLVWSVHDEVKEAGGSLAAVAIGLPVLALLALFGLIYGSAHAGEALFGSFGWGLVGGVALFFLGCMIGGLVHGLRQADQP